MRGLLIGFTIISFCAAASADVFNMGGGLTSLETVPVGNPGNAADDTGYGAVSYEYRIGKYEITTGQYTEFLNAVAKTDTYGLYNPSMWSDTYGGKIERNGLSGNYVYSVAADRANRPVVFVSFWDACRFTNWLQNGQPTGSQNPSTTERGAYALDGYNANGGGTIARNPGARWFIASEDEWYKAAYYDPSKAGGAGYWDYPTRSDTPPISEPPPGNGEPQGSSNYGGGGAFAVGAPYYYSEVGAYATSPSPYGTFDQGGNVNEWNDTVISWGSYRGIRGGGLGDYATSLPVANRGAYYPAGEYDSIGYGFGFRVAVVPEPFTLSLLALGGLAVMRRKRKV